MLPLMLEPSSLSSGDVFTLLALFLQNLERIPSKVLCGGTREVRSFKF
ncbi:hypothetical protein RchiOBHm_Chr2g0131861 [Rosa chinensis]|uniref:Uncharacterized protein n=1 Tax=Rosa chinensis TaxID=74649 RepID=A0A2P6RV72_ROSCH|nr:hypothetical protein RchiOBHm_Chr2g0131861 [Rosa chinensis]